LEADELSCFECLEWNNSTNKILFIGPSHHPTERKDDYHLLGHSWGTILAQLFVLNAPTESLKGLASMVLAGPLPLGVRKVIP